MYCKHCGKEIADDGKFCSGCGELIKENEITEYEDDGTIEDNLSLSYSSVFNRYPIYSLIADIIAVLLFIPLSPIACASAIVGVVYGYHGKKTSLMTGVRVEFAKIMYIVSIIIATIIGFCTLLWMGAFISN